ncbi:MAG: Gx transporter family protein [Actinomycetia bacterium]|nr:Gx transporter family protein [Actinomycetes bacterium]
MKSEKSNKLFFKDIKKISSFSVLLSISVVIYIIESIYLPALPIPGAKMGLANIITFILLAFFTPLACMFNTIFRIILGSLVMGSLFTPTFLISISAGVISTLVMIITYKIMFGKVSFIGVSLMGSLFHNSTQMLVASYIISSSGILIYLPLLLLIGSIFGFLNGWLGNVIVERIAFFWDNSLVTKNKEGQKWREEVLR